MYTTLTENQLRAAHEYLTRAAEQDEASRPSWQEPRSWTANEIDDLVKGMIDNLGFPAHWANPFSREFDDLTRMAMNISDAKVYRD